MPTAPDTTAGDAAFASTLSRIARDVAPAIAVDTTGVVPTARRRRDRRRSLVTASLGVVFLAGAGISQAPTWSTTPAGVADHAAIAPMSADLTIPAADADGDAGTDGGGGDAVRLAEPVAAGAAPLLPAPAAVTLTVAGAGALGAGAWLAVRARRRSGPATSL